MVEKRAAVQAAVRLFLQGTRPSANRAGVCIAVLTWFADMACTVQMRALGSVLRVAAVGMSMSGALAAAPPAPTNAAIARAFAHPGLLHTRETLFDIRRRIDAREEPWTAGFAKLRDDPQSKADWKLRGPREVVIRGGGQDRGIAEFDLDANAAYQNALMGWLTGETNHAAKCVAILRAWAATLRRVDGRDRVLGASLGGFKYINAAELMRHSGSGWDAADTAAFERMIRDALLPAIADFAPHANGNWETGCIKTMLAAGVFLDDMALVRRALGHAMEGPGNGRLTHYVVNESGQCQESGRDQHHTQLGLGHLAEACEIAWNQGIDLYGAADRRLLLGFEYTARYNLGEAVPFVEAVDTSGKYRARRISSDGRGELRPIYEMVWNHYENRRGIPAPYTRRAAEKLRPEGVFPKADHPGFGTLLFSRPPGAAARNLRTAR